MPSLFDVANDIQNTLNQIQASTQSSAATEVSIQSDTVDLRNSIHSLAAATQAGFVSLSNGVAAAIDQQRATNALLDAERQQNHTIICWLANLANVLCRSLHTQQQQLALQVSLDTSLREMKEIMETVHSAAALDVIRRRELESRLHACCPPPKTEPEPCPDACPEPGYQPYVPRVPDYQPLPQNPAKGKAGH
jgi:hypothetical protein